MNEQLQLLPRIAQERMVVVLIAAAVDLAIGDPHGLWHPVQGIGRLISASEKLMRALFHVPFPENDSCAGFSPEDACSEVSPAGTAEPFPDSDGNAPGKAVGAEHTKDPETRPRAVREGAAGICMVLIVMALSTGAAALLFYLCGAVHPLLRILAEGILCGRLLALRSLGEAGFSVRDPLLAGDVEEARRAVSMIVGRDTDRLDAPGIAKAAVETVAENTSDGVTAPLFYMFLAGGIGGTFYKAVNTMDSMVGYRNERYRYFGRAAARFDDVMNYIPSRLTALLMICACLLPGSDRVNTGKGSIRIPDAVSACRIWRRDRRKSPSPNSAQTESVCAGALHLRLLGDTWYFGELHRKEEIGDGGRQVEAQDITRAVRLMYRTAVLMYGGGLLILLAAALL